MNDPCPVVGIHFRLSQSKLSASHLVLACTYRSLQDIQERYTLCLTNIDHLLNKHLHHQVTAPGDLESIRCPPFLGVGLSHQFIRLLCCLPACPQMPLSA